MRNSKLSKRVISTKRRIVLVLAMTVKTGKVPGKLPPGLVTVNEGAVVGFLLKVLLKALCS